MMGVQLCQELLDALLSALSLAQAGRRWGHRSDVGCDVRKQGC